MESAWEDLIVIITSSYIVGNVDGESHALPGERDTAEAALFFVPMHYFTHMFLLLFSGVWATNIHDSVFFDSEPILGAKYHTLHHTHYHYNYGQVTLICFVISIYFKLIN